MIKNLSASLSIISTIFFLILRLLFIYLDRCVCSSKRVDFISILLLYHNYIPNTSDDKKLLQYDGYNAKVFKDLAIKKDLYDGYKK